MMIRYALRCPEGHDFDGWFRSSEDFDRLDEAGQVSCTHCGASGVEKVLMSPAVASDRAGPAPLRTPAADPQAQALAKLRAHVEANSDYVGLGFVAEARAMHEGRKPHRSIHGEAKVEDARRLLEDGVPVAPLPFLPKQRAN